MTNSIHLSPGSTLAAIVSTPLGRRLLSGPAVAEEPIRVDVRVRPHGTTPPLARRVDTTGVRAGRLPVGTLLDCYL